MDEHLSELYFTYSLQGNILTDFIQSFEIDLSYAGEEIGIRSGFDRRNKDITDLSRYLTEKVIDKNKIVQVTTGEIINDLGWKGRIDTIFNHDLIIDPNRYQPITSTLEQLDQLVSRYSNGYVFLLGGPGTGKSTLLTDWAEGKENVVRYYAFDFTKPSSYNNNSERGETTSFLSDLVKQLKKHAGIYPDHTLPYENPVFLRKVLQEQLEKLSEMYRNTGKKTIIIIDGLDHVPRYGNVQKSFLADLFLPMDIPEGVLVILGSQSFDLEALPLEIKRAWQSDDRAIPIQPLAKEEVFAYGDKISTIPLSTEQKELLYIISQGHPLYLSYLVNKINQDLIFDFGEEFIPVDGDISLYYEKLWSQVEPLGISELLALSARVEGSIAIPFIKEWGFSDEKLTKFRKTWFLFHRSSETLTIFHNSFRQFLLTKTATSPLEDTHDQRKDRNYYLQLAAFYEGSDVEQKWNAIYYYYKASAYEKFLALAMPQAFTDQFLQFRPESELQRDLKLGLLVAKEHNDANLTLRFLLSLQEMEGRSRYVSSSSYVEQFIALGEIDLAKKLLRSNTDLKVNKSFALQAARWLSDAGEMEEAKLIYSMAKPKDVTKNGIVIIESGHRLHGTIDLLEEWATTAALFEEGNTIFKLCSNISAKENEDNDEQELYAISNRLMNTSASAFAELAKWEQFDKLLELWNSFPHLSRSRYVFALITAARESLNQNDQPKAVHYLRMLKEGKASWNYGNIHKMMIAGLIYRIENDRGAVKEWIEGIPQPELKKTGDLSMYTSIHDFTDRIVLNKLLVIAGKDPNIHTLIPEETEINRQLVAEFERKLILLAKILGFGWLKQSGENLWQRALPLVRFYYTKPNGRNTVWFHFEKIQKEYFELLVQSASLWEQEAFTSFAENLLDEFNNYPKHWPVDIKRSILLKLHELGYSEQIVAERLSSLEAIMFENQDTSGRVDQCFLQAKAWVQLREKEKAMHWLKECLRQSFSVGYRKDYQFNRWLHWLRQVNAIQPEAALKRTSLFLSFLPHLKESTEGSSFYSGAREVFRIACEHNVFSGVQQFIWQIQNGLIDFDSSLAIALQALVAKANSREEVQEIAIVFQQLLLFITEDDVEELLEAILVKQHALFNNAVFQEKVQEHIQSIQTNYIEKNRSALLERLGTFLMEKGVGHGETVLPETATPKKNNNSSNNLQLKQDHSSLSEEEVLSRISTFQDFTTLYNQEDKGNSYFSWIKIIQKILPQLAAENIRELTGMIQPGPRQSELLAQLSQRAVLLGDKDLANQLADMALAYSSPSGWSSFYDGGSRLSAIQAYHAIDGVNGVKKAMAVLTEDISEGSDHDSLLASWEEIIPLLTNKIDYIGIWNEIQDYLERMFSGVSLIEVPAFVEGDKKLALPQLVFYIAGLPVKTITTPTMQLLAEFCSNNEVVRDRVTVLCKGSNYEQLLASEILLLLSGKNPAATKKFESELKGLALSGNLEIRANVVKALTRLASSIPQPEPKELNAVFQLALPEDTTFRVERKTSSFENVEITDDPIKLLSSYKWWLPWLENETGLSKESIVHRWFRIIYEQNIAEQLKTETEIEWQKKLKTLSIEFPFQRPRSIAVKQALNYLLAELLDAGVLDDTVMEMINTIDPTLEWSVKIERRPDFVLPLTDEKTSYIGEEWVNQIETSKRVGEGLVRYGDNLIIAEFSCVRKLIWGQPLQTYHTEVQMVTQGHKENDTSSTVQNQYLEDYFGLTEEVPKYLTILNENEKNFHLGFLSQWIAFNPALAKKLEWVPSAKANFAWEDADGNLMAYSVYWRSSHVYMGPRKEGEAGDGWYVVLTRKGGEALSSLEVEWQFLKEIYRKWTYDGKKRERTLKKKNVLPSNLFHS